MSCSRSFASGIIRDESSFSEIEAWRTDLFLRIVEIIFAISLSSKQGPLLRLYFQDKISANRKLEVLNLFHWIRPYFVLFLSFSFAGIFYVGSLHQYPAAML